MQQKQIQTTFPYHIKVIGDLPYYIPFPEKIILTPSLIGSEPYRLMLEHFQPLRHPEDSHANGADDRIGTFIRSRVIIEFDLKDEKNVINQIYLGKALKLTNKLIESIRYYMSDFSLRPVLNFDHFIVQQYNDNSEIIRGSEGNTFSPFGIENLRQIPMEKVQNIWWYFNGINSMNPARMLLLDSMFHSKMGDINRSILDLGTALEINIGWLVDQYKFVNHDLDILEINEKSIWDLYDVVLKSATNHSLHEYKGHFINLEFIRGIRNSVAHKWEPIFRITKSFKSDYLEIHKEKDGTIIESQEQLEDLIKSTREIINLTEELFANRYQLSN